MVGAGVDRSSRTKMDESWPDGFRRCLCDDARLGSFLIGFRFTCGAVTGRDWTDVGTFARDGTLEGGDLSGLIGWLGVEEGGGIRRTRFIGWGLGTDSVRSCFGILALGRASRVGSFPDVLLVVGWMVGAGSRSGTDPPDTLTVF